MRIPLAWRNSTSNLSKLVLSGAGIGFAVLLMFSQVGFLNGLFDSAVQILKLIDADLIALSRARYTVPSEQRFDLKLLRHASTVPQVDTAFPIYIDRALADIRVIGNPSRSIRAIGVPIGYDLFLSKEMNQAVRSLSSPDQILVDRKSKPKYGFEKSDLNLLHNQAVELSGRSARLNGWVDIGTDFVYDGSIVLTDRGVERFLPHRNANAPPLEAVDLGLIRLKSNDANSVELAKQAIAPLLGIGVEILTKQELIDREIAFWARSTPIGIIFSIGTVMGLLVGVIICYQILFTDISDHLAEFATLKAMGYGPSYFLTFILCQSFYLTIIGFIPGLLASIALYHILSEWSGLVMVLTPGRVAFVFALTFIMCTISGLLALRKLWSADPASLF